MEKFQEEESRGKKTGSVRVSVKVRVIVKEMRVE
jgi:hypothetical protein